MSGLSVRTFRNLLRNKALRAIGFTIAGLVALSMVIFFAYVPPMGLSGAQRGGTNTGGQEVLRVGNYTINEGELEQYLRLIQQGQEPDSLGMQLSQRYQALRSLGEQLAFVSQLEKAGFRASDADIEQFKEEFLKQQLDTIRAQLLPNGKGSDRDLDRALRERGKSLEQVKQELLSPIPEIVFTAQATQSKYIKSLHEKYNPTDEQLRLMFENLYPARIFISQEKHKDKAEARAQAAYNQLKAGKPFAEVVKQYSDDPKPLVDRGGSLPGSDYYTIQDQLSGYLRPEDVSGVLALKPGAFTPPLKDKENRGYYIFTLTKRELKLPDDFEKEKAKYREQFINMRVQQEVFRARMEALRAFKLQIKDPLMAQYEKWFGVFAKPPHEQEKELEAIDNALTPLIAKPTPTTRMAQWLQVQVLAQLRGLAKKTDEKKARQYTERLLTALTRFFNEGGEDLSLRMMRAELLIELGQKEKAIDDLQIAQSLAWRPYDFPQLDRIASLYEKAGRKDLARQAEQLARQRQKQMEEMRKAQEEAIRRQMEAFRKQQAEEQKKQKAAQPRPSAQPPADAKSAQPAAKTPAPQSPAPNTQAGKESATQR
ncbi:Foldase protein PrsA [bacterium HR15]|nr:Foldase protein PrsA [bacterium HR15]